MSERPAHTQRQTDNKDRENSQSIDANVTLRPVFLPGSASLRLVAQSIIPGILHGDQQSRLMYGSVESGVRLKVSYQQPLRIFHFDNPAISCSRSAKPDG